MSAQMTLAEFNSSESVMEHLLRCCGCQDWAQRVESHRPYTSFQALRARASVEWFSLSSDHWREGFLAHPRIGDKEALREKYAPGKASSWEAGEQSGVNTASEKVLDELAEMNDRYDAKFGFLFLICATGKTAEEMLIAIRVRLLNSIEEEILHFKLCIGAAEQDKITEIRLHKLIQEDGIDGAPQSKL